VTTQAACTAPSTWQGAGTICTPSPCPAPAGLDLSVSFVYITQSTQTPAFNVPLVKDRNGFLRAFVLANGANSTTPPVRVRIYDSGHALRQTYTISSPGASVPTSINEGSISSSWNVAVPGTLIQPGYYLLVDVDPDNLVSEANEANNTWPPSGSAQALDVRDLQVLNMTLAPVASPSGTGGVNGGNAASYMDYTRRLHPIPDYTVQVRAAINSAVTLSADGTGWDTMLSEVTAQRAVDGSSRYYFGVLHVTYSSGVAGIGWIGQPVAIGWDYLPSASWVLAHEIGHNFGFGHTGCSGEADPDPGYPYPGGAIGVYGYDLWASSLKDKSAYKDVMSYCNPQWISDYTYKEILSFRQGSPIGLRGPARAELPKEPCLLVWGLRSRGELTLEPSFLVSTRPSLPTPGPYRVEGLDTAGSVVWSQSFGLTPTTLPNDATSAGFCFAAPMPADLLDRVAVLRVVESGREIARRSPAEPASGPGFRRTPAGMSLNSAGPDAVDLAWDSSSAPVVMIRDLEQDACIGFARGGSMRLATPSRHLELLFSDGVHTRTQQWP
jgi:hypothetical protein